ncbi:MAG: GTPase ObgE [Elusimicrobiales bacterium]|jgi:GTP-binding protein
MKNDLNTAPGILKNQTRSERTDFIDTARVYLRAGKGGDGCASFRREKFVPYGGPNGGNGGKGGDIYFEASTNITTLHAIANHPHIRATEGGPGQSKHMSGLKGSDILLHVPCGTIVKFDGRVVADLKRHGDRFLAARGGRGGRGNTSFKTKFNTAPKISENGEPGQEFTADLELSVLADIGLVGFPNAGKSTLLSTISAAKPKIAAYPFTTLTPHLGIVSHKGKSFAAADIPGLIEGAHEGRGLGDLFLKHVLRTKLLIHLVDPAGFGKFKPVDSVAVIAKELKTYHPELAKKQRILAVSKADLPEAKKVHDALAKKYKKHPVFLISAATGAGIKGLLDYIIALLPKIKEPAVYKPELDRDATALHKPVREGFKISEAEDGLMEANSEALTTIIAMTNFNQPDSINRLRRIFKLIGLDKALKKAGVLPGDQIRIAGKNFEWSEHQITPPHKRSKFAYKYQTK